MTRIIIVAALAILSWITYLDRAAISSVKTPVAAELKLDDRAMGAVFSAFALGYALGQIPAGKLADRLGPRLLLAGVVVLWSLLTGLTGAVQSFGLLLVVRFAFGLAEAGAYPGTARAFYAWLPPSEHGRANGIVFAASRIGAALAFPGMAWLLAHYDWRQAFYLLSVPGLIWGALWWLLFRDKPVPAGATSTITIAEALRTTPFRLALFQYFATNFTTFLCLSWMNPYLMQRYSLTVAQAAPFTMVPLLVGATAQWISGWTVDRLYVSAWREWSRAAPAMTGFVIAAVGAALIPLAPDPTSAAACFALATFGVEITISPAWAFCIDLGGKNSGSISGTMNMAGNFGSFVSANAFPWLQTWTGSAAAYFYLLTAMNLLSAVAWSLMRMPTSRSRS